MIPPKLFILIGLPASGKSTWAKKMSETMGYEVVSSDSIREEWYGSESIQGDNNKVFAEMHRRTVQYLSEGKSVIYDATNLTFKSRAFIRNYAPLVKLKVFTTAVQFVTPFSDCCERNSRRERVVPYSVMERMYKNYTPPVYSEGFSSITYKIIPTVRKYDIKQEVQRLMIYNQNNPHHPESLGQHLSQTFEFLKRSQEPRIALVGWCHDIGKPFCRTTDDNGISHYYGHESVSAYETLCYWYYGKIDTLIDKTFDIYYICNLVRWHMELYKETLSKDFKLLIAKNFSNWLSIINEADRTSRNE